MSDVCSIGELRELIKNQQQKIDRLEKRVQAAEKRIETAEIHSRQDCLILRGKIDIRPNCSLRDEVMRLIQHHTGVQFPPWCLNTVHWLGKGGSLIVRFNNKGVREAIYRNRIPKDATKRGLFIHECLTSAKVQTISKCAKLRSDGRIATYYTQMGHVYVKKTRELPSIMLPDHLSEQEIINLLTEQPSSYRGAVIHGQRSGTQSLTGKACEQVSNAVSEATVMPPSATVATPAPNSVATTSEEIKTHAPPTSGDVQAPPKTSMGAVPETEVVNLTVHTEGTNSAPIGDTDKTTEDSPPLSDRQVVLGQSQNGKGDGSKTVSKDTQVESEANAAKNEDAGAVRSDAKSKQDRPCDSMSDTSSSPGRNVPQRKSKRNRNRKCK